MKLSAGGAKRSPSGALPNPRACRRGGVTHDKRDLRGIGAFPRRADVARAASVPRLNADRGSTLWAPRAIGWWIGILFAVGAKQFRAEREKVTEASKETIGNIIDQLSAIEKRLERRSTLEDSTDEIKADLAELKGMRAEVQSLKESVDAKKREE